MKIPGKTLLSKVKVFCSCRLWDAKRQCQMHRMVSWTCMKLTGKRTYQLKICCHVDNCTQLITVMLSCLYIFD